mgnify:CR=1 FL=1
MDVQVDRFGKVEAEDSHDGFCVDYVSSGYQIKIIIKLTKDFTLSIELREICTVFMFVILPVIWLTLFITLI